MKYQSRGKKGPTREMVLVRAPVHFLHRSFVVQLLIAPYTFYGFSASGLTVSREEFRARFS